LRSSFTTCSNHLLLCWRRHVIVYVSRISRGCELSETPSTHLLSLRLRPFVNLTSHTTVIQFTFREVGLV
jgi:hypothetical protein